MKRCCRLLLIAALLLAAAFPALAGEVWKLTILHTNDLHGMLLPFDYAGGDLPLLQGKKTDVGGLARRAALLKQLRGKSGNPMVVVEAGDVFTRGPWHRKFYGVPEIEAMNLMGYDMLALGNNEFKATGGVDSQKYLQALIKRSRFPWLAANLALQNVKGAGAFGKPVPGVKPFIVKRFGKVRVGFLGLTTQAIAGFPQVTGWIVSDPIKAAQYWVPIVRKQCDILIAVTHLGLGADQLVAARVAGIDALVGGHSHSFLSIPLLVKNPAGIDVPIVQAGELGVVLGKFDLTFEHDKTWRLIKAEEKLLPITNALPEDKAVKKLLEKYLKEPARKPALNPATG
jgi:2',3'-cyclic-nucleotide 2'-phosphodiesterase (5'-nucleotidase family)